VFALNGLGAVSQFHMQKCATLVRGLSASKEFGMRRCEAHIGPSGKTDATDGTGWLQFLLLTIPIVRQRRELICKRGGASSRRL
jgi:hypothetical protein